MRGCAPLAKHGWSLFAALHTEMYGVTVDFFTQYELTTSSYLTFRGNDLSHACGDSQGECSIHLMVFYTHGSAMLAN
jgi:hypothetical protein